MSLSIGIVGLPNVGKSTLFNALTRKGVLIANYPFATIDPSVGVVAVPDLRLDRLADMSSSAKKIPAAVEFVDIAGLVKGASEGEGLGNQFLSHIREVDAIAEVVRIFDDEDIHHVAGGIDPRYDIEIIDLELVQADLQSAEKQLDRVERDAKSGDKESILERDVLQRIVPALRSGKPARAVQLDEKEALAVKGLHLLTMKPFLYVLNRKSGAVNVDAEGDNVGASSRIISRHRIHRMCSSTPGCQNDLSDVHSDEKADFRRELGVADDGLDDLIKAGYKLLDLISFFTTGADESRAWTIRRGDKAPMWALPFTPISATNSSAQKLSIGTRCSNAARGKSPAKKACFAPKGKSTSCRMATLWSSNTANLLISSPVPYFSHGQSKGHPQGFLPLGRRDDRALLERYCIYLPHL